MIRLTTEQAQQIEEALEDIVRVFKFETGTPVEALASIRAARAQEQAEQEPVAWYLDTFDEDGELDYREYNSSNKFSCGQGNGTPLYAYHVRTKDLTDDEICKLVKQVRFDGMTDRTFQFARAVIVADREKNKC